MQVREENVGILQFGFLQVTVAQICTTQFSALEIRPTWIGLGQFRPHTFLGLGGNPLAVLLQNRFEVFCLKLS